MTNQTLIENYQKRIKRIVITEEEIKEAIKKVGAEIAKSYTGRPLLLVSVLKGAFVFMADLSRAINAPCEIAFMCAKSYFSGTSSSGEVNIIMDIDRDIKDLDVIIVEDIVDTGRTLKRICEILKERKPHSLRVVSLLDKPDRRVVDFNPDISLFTIPDFFVIGYGLDCAEQYRNLPYIAEYNQEV
ncbi:MAG: hypoxanthine phosphoribosyltransferase [Clostridia bacterium]|nr:hypoxanthine phosphoribosyltransferase [Clostridia bacterium]